jgi:hypothetical protein
VFGHISIDFIGAERTKKQASVPVAASFDR